MAATSKRTAAAHCLVITASPTSSGFTPSTDFGPDLCRSIAHGLQFSERDMTRHVFHAAIRRDHKAIRRDMLEAVADSIRDHRGRLNLGIAEVEHPEHD